MTAGDWVAIGWSAAIVVGFAVIMVVAARRTMSAPDYGHTNVHVLLEPEAEEVSIGTRGATVVLQGADAVRMVRDRLSRHLVTMAEYSDVECPPVDDVLAEGGRR